MNFKLLLLFVYLPIMLSGCMYRTIVIDEKTSRLSYDFFLVGFNYEYFIVSHEYAAKIRKAISSSPRLELGFTPVNADEAMLYRATHRIGRPFEGMRWKRIGSSEKEYTPYIVENFVFPLKKEPSPATFGFSYYISTPKNECFYFDESSLHFEMFFVRLVKGNELVRDICIQNKDGEFKWLGESETRYTYVKSKNLIEESNMRYGETPDGLFYDVERRKTYR